MPLPHADYKLGKLPARHDTRTLKLARYTAALPPPPPQCWYQERISAWEMFGNDTLGDCVAAAAGHMVMQWTAYAGTAFIPAESDIIKFYEYSGYDPNDPSTDQGWELLSALQVWRANGVAGHKVAAYMSINPSDMEQLKLAVQLFGNVYLGIQLPLNAQDQSSWHIDDTDPETAVAGSWGGHCVPIVGYDVELFTCVTWGALMNMSPHWIARYSDEAYAVVSADWITQAGNSPSGFDMAQLITDLSAVTANAPNPDNVDVQTPKSHY